ncbi:hypothetical protein CKA32_002642 [Geitlerinema sp. FC II]|nr:hypothetical protein CKA32_002642 [Geitlerinema sp. FC II]
MLLLKILNTNSIARFRAFKCRGLASRNCDFYNIWMVEMRVWTYRTIASLIKAIGTITKFDGLRSLRVVPDRNYPLSIETPRKRVSGLQS